ncbi:hypothetical protein E0E46_06580 [Gardnerella vaginalis ATCC 14018 = JCM 11026]|nr:hypothetical protein E0E46_06580 [Gardnerella vaginalis ATCC 14018 = JCM 11026]TCH81558.1 hypothetical protein E0E48_01495 [Gardnerella vaginalis]
MRDDLPFRLKRSAKRQFGALSRSNVKSSGLYVRRRRSRAVTRERHDLPEFYPAFVSQIGQNVNKCGEMCPSLFPKSGKT